MSNRGIAAVLLSGGIDSTTCLYIANKAYLDNHFDQVVGVSVDYGQRHKKEMEHARDSCSALDWEHHIIEAKGLIPRTMLTDSTIAIPKVSYDEIKGVSPTYVPFRNGTMLSLITAWLVGQLKDKGIEAEDGESGIYFGAHAEDAANWAYPDCTPEFIGAMANAIYVGTYRSIRLHTPLQWLTKSQIIKWGEELYVPWSNTWSCYAGGEFHCGECPTCRARQDGFEKAFIKDPTFYATMIPSQPVRTPYDDEVPF